MINHDVPGLVRDIRSLGRRLLEFESRNDPQVQAALHQLDVQLVGLISPSGGRHRMRSGVGPNSEAMRDVHRYPQKPNPLAASTSAELVEAMREYRRWSGNPTYRAIAERAHHAVAHSTIYVALHSSDLPARAVVVATIVGCGGSAEDQRMFATAWEDISSGGMRGAGFDLLS